MKNENKKTGKIVKKILDKALFRWYTTPTFMVLP
jgi:hypothetical protein